MTVPIVTSLWRKIALILFGFILSVASLEAGMRLSGFVLSSIQDYGNLKSARQKDAYRILCLGESTTSEQYPRLLERALNQCNAGIRFSVIDKGRPASNTTGILGEVEGYLAEYRPDMVVVMMGINDRGIKYYQDIFETNAWIFQYCRVYRFVRILLKNFSLRFKKNNIHDTHPTVEENSRLKGFANNDGGHLGEDQSSAIHPHRPQAPRDIRIASEGLYLDRERSPELDAVLKGNPESSEAFVELGWLYRVQGKSALSEDFFKKAIELDAKNDNAYFELARLYLDQGKFAQVEIFLKKAIETNPKNDYALIESGRLYLSKGRFGEAENSFKQAVVVHPEGDQPRFELGWFYRAQGELLQAETLLQKAVELNPHNNRALKALASLNEEMGKSNLAKEYSQKADQCEQEAYRAITVNNYRKLKVILDKKGMRLVCVQYPMRSLAPLKNIFEGDAGVVFVDNEKVFKDAVKKESYGAYFRDMFAGDFGHCTQKGNELLAQNIADVILKEVFNK